jgi:hypothetical protein
MQPASWDLRSFEILRSVDWYIVTDVSDRQIVSKTQKGADLIYTAAEACNHA